MQRIKVRARREEKKPDEAHEKKQLEYLCSAGIDLREVEKEHEEDAHKLKSYLEHKRPPLISHPKQAPHFLTNLGGQPIPLTRVSFFHKTPVWRCQRSPANKDQVETNRRRGCDSQMM